MLHPVGSLCTWLHACKDKVFLVYFNTHKRRKRKKNEHLLNDIFLLCAGMVYAIDVNEGRLRILKEAAQLQDLAGVITAIHSDLRSYSVSCYSV